MTQEDFDLAVINRIMSYGNMFHDEPPVCWTKIRADIFESRVFGKNMGEDRMAVYRTDPTTCPDRVDTCVLSIAGTNDHADSLSNVNLFWGNGFCGINDMHAGVAGEANSILEQTEKWTPFVAYLAKCPRIVFSGHSLGGAIATALATCANCNRNSVGCSRPAEIQGIKQEVELYSFAAFAVLPNPPWNGMHPHGIFKGKRIWGYDSTSHPWSVDIVSQITNIGGFRHPKILTIGLDVATQDAQIEEGDAEDAPDEPQGVWWPSFDSLHSMDKYIGAVVGHMPENPFIRNWTGQLPKFGMPLYLSSHRGAQIVDYRGSVGLSPNRHDREAAWTLRDAGDGKVFIVSHRGELLQDLNGQAQLSSNKGDWEKWRIVDAGGDQVFIQSHRNHQLQEYQGQLRITWRAEAAEKWSVFEAGGRTTDGNAFVISGTGPISSSYFASAVIAFVTFIGRFP